MKSPFDYSFVLQEKKRHEEHGHTLTNVSSFEDGHEYECSCGDLIHIGLATVPLRKLETENNR